MTEKKTEKRSQDEKSEMQIRGRKNEETNNIIRHIMSCEGVKQMIERLQREDRITSCGSHRDEGPENRTISTASQCLYAHREQGKIREKLKERKRKKRNNN